MTHDTMKNAGITATCQNCGKTFPVPPSRVKSTKWCSRKCLADISIRYRVDAITGCWLWLGAISNTGYGRLGPRYDETLAHRVFYILYRGPIPDGLTLDHLCRNRSCVNPSHLEPVTNAENCARGAQYLRTFPACRHGHLWTPENTYIQPRSGSRICRECVRDAQVRYDQRRAEK